MPTMKYVTRNYQVAIPDDRDMVRKHVREHVGNDEDTDIIMRSDDAIAVWLSYQYDIGNYTSAVDILDVDVSDEAPVLEEFEIKEES